MNSLREKGQVKLWKVCCALGAPLLLLLLVTGELRAQDFSYTNTNGTITITGYTGPGGNVTIPSAIAGTPVTAIGGQAFWGAPLTAITIPNSVTNIEDGVGTKGGGLGAFAFCNALTNVSMGNGVLYIGMGTFALCNGLKQVSIPDSVRTLGDFAFHGCLSLSDVRIGNSVTQLGPGFGYAFDGGTNLASIVIPGNVTNLGNYTFAYSTSLAGVTLEEGVTRIGNNSFFSCPSLTNITLPASITVIDQAAFAYCANLAGVFFKGNAPATTGDAVFSSSTNVTVYYLPGTSGWGPTYAGRPTKLWNPQAQTSDGAFGVQQNQFGFNITGTPDIPIIIEASADLAATSWLGLQTCTLTNGSIYFSDPQWTNYPRRFYRIRSP